MPGSALNEKCRTCLVVGASGDIGNAIAVRLHAAGHRLFLTASSASTIPADAGGFTWRAVDVTNPQQVTSVVEEVAASSENRFHLIYCAGTLNDRPIPNLSPEDWRKIMAINVDGAFYALRAAFRPLAVGGAGRVVLIGSASSLRAVPGQAAYSASKAALDALCRVAAIELGRFGITCNVVAPGALESGMVRDTAPDAIQKIVSRTPRRRLGTVEEVASTVIYLLSDGAAHINAQTIVLDGGLTAS